MSIAGRHPASCFRLRRSIGHLQPINLFLDSFHRMAPPQKFLWQFEQLEKNTMYAGANMQKSPIYDQTNGLIGFPAHGFADSPQLFAILASSLSIALDNCA